MTVKQKSLKSRPLAALVIAAIRVYQAARVGRPSPCRFYPSCSVYGLEAVERHGALRGSLLSVQRISRCRPGGSSGIDLVPCGTPPTLKEAHYV